MSGQTSGVVCVDIGGTYIKSGLLENGRLCDVCETQTPAEGGEAVVQAVLAIVARYPGADKIGVSTAGEVDAESGCIRYAENIANYSGLSLKSLLCNASGLPVVLENDVNAAALGELHFGAGKTQNLRSFLMVSYGTGIGGAIVLDGALLRGAHGSAGEIGGIVAHPEATVFGEVGSGSYERYAATSALVQRASKLSPEYNNGRAVFAAMEQKPVQMVVDRWIDEMAYGLVSAIHLLDPGAVVLGGGILREDSVYQQLTERVGSLLKPTFVGTSLYRAQLGNEASLYGAGMLAQLQAD